MKYVVRNVYFPGIFEIESRLKSRKKSMNFYIFTLHAVLRKLPGKDLFPGNFPVLKNSEKSLKFLPMIFD